MIPAYITAALNKVPNERQSKPFHFVTLETLAPAITPAQINVTGGFVIIPRGSYLSEQLIITGFRLRVNSANAGGAAFLVLATTDATPVVIASFTQASLTSGAVLGSNTTGVVLQAGFATKLTLGTGIVLAGSTSATVLTQANLTGALTVDVIPLSLQAR